MTTHELIRRYFDAWNRGDLDAFDGLVAPDYVNHSPAGPPPLAGPAGLKPIVSAMRTGIPDLHYEVVHSVCEGDLAAAHTRVTRTHLGELFGAPATGRRIDLRQLQIERVRGGQIVEHWRLTEPF